MTRRYFLLTVTVLFQFVHSAPTQKEPKGDTDERKGKNLAFYNYIQPEEPTQYSYENDYLYPLDNEISRTIPSRKPASTPSLSPFNSPIYYIRLPPQPYMYVPGLGYVSQPQAPPTSQFLNLPVNFVSNGKPNTIYQWSGGFQGFPTVTPRPQKPKPTDSTIHRLPGHFSFNGKPDDIFLLRDSYNSIYSDALQNFYP